MRSSYWSHRVIMLLPSVQTLTGSLGWRFSGFFFLPGVNDNHPAQQHPLPSYMEYSANSSVTHYQTRFFPSQCTQEDDTTQTLDITVGAQTQSLGGACDPEISRNQFCDGPLKPKTAYRWRRWCFFPLCFIRASVKCC